MPGNLRHQQCRKTAYEVVFLLPWAKRTTTGLPQHTICMHGLLGVLVIRA